MTLETRSDDFLRACETLRKIQESSDTPRLQGCQGTHALEAWLVGPKGENIDVLEELIVEAIHDQAFWRRNFHPGDPIHITERMKRSVEYTDGIDVLKESTYELLAFLKKSVPFFSMRYQGHMNWDLTVPSIVGYFAAMLYNPNNVAFEASTATTLLENLVGEDLCRMLGYTIPDSDDEIRPWGHITCGGTVANIEAIWAARNLKLYPLALQEAVRYDENLKSARDIEVPLPTGSSKKLLELKTWEALNLVSDDILALPERLDNEHGIDRDVVSEAMAPYSVQDLGLVEFSRRFLDKLESPVFTVPGNKHYSFPKAAAVLGIGRSHMLDVPVDLDARQDVEVLRKKLEECLENRQAVYTVVAVTGSTEESAVDPLDEILALQADFRKRGLEFTVHADAAWGGYFASLFRDDFEMPAPTALTQNDTSPKDAEPPPPVPLNQYVRRQFQVLGRADSITVDPHKSGYIPYPAGALCYRNGSMRDLVTFAAPVIFKGGPEPTTGIFGIEGSKPGAAAASVYLSHRVIRPSKSGYGKLLGKALYSTKKFYARLLTMAGENDEFTVTPVPRLPSERRGEDVEAELQSIRKIVHNPNLKLKTEDIDRLVELGPDQNILSYAFNFKLPDGSLNRELENANRLNEKIYGRLSIDPGHDIYRYDLIVSSTRAMESHGRDFIENMKRRLGVGGSTGDSIYLLRSVIMDPWITETDNGRFLDVLITELRKAVKEERANLLRELNVEE